MIACHPMAARSCPGCTSLRSITRTGLLTWTDPVAAVRSGIIFTRPCPARTNSGHPRPAAVAARRTGRTVHQPLTWCRRSTGGRLSAHAPSPPDRRHRLAAGPVRSPGHGRGQRRSLLQRAVMAAAATAALVISARLLRAASSSRSSLSYLCAVDSVPVVLCLMSAAADGRTVFGSGRYHVMFVPFM